jgi:AraC-like DNA-binding protein
LLKYIDSLEPYFIEPEKVKGSLVKIKLLELLFYLAGMDNNVLEQVLDLREQFRYNITATVEENIMNSLSLNQLAVLSGRSLSSFRRDFLAIYNMPPSQWIRQKRLEKAQELLLSTTMTITDICYTSGFESIAHFSRLFKSQFGYPPSEFRMNVLVA